MAGAPGGADLADNREDHILGADPGAEAAIDLDQHVFGGGLDQGLGGEHVLDLGGADAKGERAHRAMRRGVAVAADDRHARLAQPLLRPDDVDDALVDAVDREIGDAELLHIALQGVDLQPRFRVVDAAAAIARRHVVVGHRHRRVGPANLAAGELQPFEGLRRRDLVDQVKIDVDQVGAFALRGDDVVLPDLVKEGARRGHGCGHSDWLVSSAAPAISGAGSVWVCTLALARLAPGRTLSRARSVMRARLPVRPRR